MDLWSVLLNRVFAIAPPNWGLVGRWVFHLKHGVVFHSDIQIAQETAGETRIGWAFHYGVGIIYGVLFIALIGADWLRERLLVVVRGRRVVGNAPAAAPERRPAVDRVVGV